MPIVFYSPEGPAGKRSTMSLEKDEIQHYRKRMEELETQVRRLPHGNLPLNEISLSGSFPVEEIAMMIAQNKDCTHLSFFTGFDEVKGHFTLLVPMKDVVPGEAGSGTIIDEPVTIYSAICCQHPPLITM